MKITGKSIDKRDILVGTCYHLRGGKGNLSIISYDGKIKYQQHFANKGIDNFRNFILNNKSYYSYQLVAGKGEKLPRITSGNKPSTLVITDDKLNVIKDNIKLLPYGSIKEITECDCHEYRLIDLNHYYLTGHIAVKVNNIPGISKELWVANCIIQEQKDGKVIWQFETIDYPELYELSQFKNNYHNSQYDEIACDYAHLNSFQLTSDNKYMYISYRNIGVIVIEKETKKIISELCYRVDKNIKLFGQHDLRLFNDHKFSIFNNNALYMKEIIGNKKSQVAIISLDDDFNLIAIDYINLPEKAACSIGGAILIDEKTQTWDITYSPYATFTQVQEYSISTGQVYFKATMPTLLNWEYCYRIERAERNYGEEY